MGSICTSCGKEARKGRTQCMPCYMFPRNLRKYGLSLEGYEALLAEQGGVCAICKLPETSERLNKVRRLCIDHDHETGAIRGLLCNRCNRVIGLMDDDPVILGEAMDYLSSVSLED